MKRLTAVLLTLGIILAIVADSTDFFFHRPYYEYWDLAANSLSVIRAKHFSELYGSYSRWGFHHPGPIFFYVQALGEWVFYDLLHLTPAPFNGQTLANLCLTASFFVAALSCFSRWLTEPARRLFVPAALVVAAVHFGAVARMPSYDMLLGCTPFTSAWTAHSWVFPFLCMLTAGASIMAGQGRDLPLLALAVGFLIHAHIAAPLFVGPVVLLAYAGLLATCISRDRGAASETASSLPVWKRPRWALGSAWRAFPRFHIAALAILTVFALPIVIDLFLGDESNFHAVLTHLRLHQGEHKSLARSIFYFVQFGAYRPYKAHVHAFKRFDAAGAYAYLWYHKKIYAAWICGVLLVLWLSALRPALVALRRRQDRSVQAPADSVSLPPTSDYLRLLVCAGVFLALSIVLTLKWGMMQDGEMFYYSGWINFAIYYFGLMIVLAEFSSVLAVRLDRWKQRDASAARPWIWIERIVPVVAVALVCYLEATRFRVIDPTPQVTRALHESNLRVVQEANARNPNGIKILDMPFLSWPMVTGLALEMERQGQRYMVVSVFTACFPQSKNWRPSSPVEQEIMEVWHFKLGKLYKLLVSGVPKWWVSRGETLERQLIAARQHPSAPDQPMMYSLLDDVELRIDLPKLDPNTTDHASIDFRKPPSNFKDEHYGFYKHPKFALILKQMGTTAGCSLYGFSEPEDWGTWNEGTGGMLRVRGEMVADSNDVEIHLKAHPFLAPDAKLISQRLSLSINGTALGPEETLFGDEDVVYTVPGALWNKTLGQSAGGALEFHFPDAVSPAKIESDNEQDGRRLGVGFSEITVRAIPAEHGRPSLELGGAGKPAELDFKPGGNAGGFATEGWYAPESWGTWSSGHASALHFYSRPVEGTREVEITLDIRSVMETDSGIKGQRVRVTLGDKTIDREHVVTGAGPLVLKVSAADWNAAVADNAEAVLRLEFPDAISPARIDPSGKEQDERLLALAIERISFRDVAVPVITLR